MAGDDDILAEPIPALGRMLRRGETTPTRLARLALDALDGRGRALNAVVTLLEDRAMRHARLAEAELAAGRDRGPLHGIPWGAKDLLAVAGAPTGWGAAPYRDQVFDFDATAVERLDAAGAVLVAKLAMVELAGGMGYEEPDSQFTGPGRNPWNPDRWTSGSSTGSAAAVADRLVPFSIGSETNGSIVGPAAHCGVTGIRPTYGRVSRHGAMALAWSLDRLGPYATSADAAWPVFAAIAGADPRDPTTVHRPVGAPAGDGRRFRVAVPEDWRTAIADDVAAAFSASLDTLGEIATIETVRLPEFPAQEAIRILIMVEAASAFEDLIASGRCLTLTGASHRPRPFLAAAIPARDYLRVQRLRVRIGAAMVDLLGGVDALATPTMPTEAQPVDQPMSRLPQPHVCGRLGALANLAGLPAVALPNGFGANGLPTGLLLTGRPWSEARLTALAAAVQARTSWHQARPNPVPAAAA